MFARKSQRVLEPVPQNTAALLIDKTSLDETTVTSPWREVGDVRSQRLPSRTNTDTATQRAGLAWRSRDAFFVL